MLVPTFSSFAAIQRTFQKNFNWIFKFVAFLMQHLMLNRLTPVSNPKNEKAKSSYGRACRAGVCVCVFYHKK